MSFQDVAFLPMSTHVLDLCLGVNKRILLVEYINSSKSFLYQSSFYSTFYVYFRSL